MSSETAATTEVKNEEIPSKEETNKEETSSNSELSIDSKKVWWLPLNPLIRHNEPARNTRIDYEVITVKDAVNRIITNDFDFEKYLVQERDRYLVGIFGCFLFGNILGGLSGYNEGQEMAKQFVGKAVERGPETFTGKEVNNYSIFFSFFFGN